MSVARVTRVDKSRKPGTCGKCHTDLPVGSGYLWYKVGFRSRYKNVRCLKPECWPRESERESSLLSSVYAAKEAALDQLDSIEGEFSVDDAQAILDEYAQAIREVSEEYGQAKEDENGNVFNTTAEEREEALESAADDVEGYSLDESDTDCEDCEGNGHTDCSNCDGTGKVECGTCEGSGYAKDDDGDESSDNCPDCNGSAEKDCDATGCEGGEIACTNEACEEGRVPDTEALIESVREALETDLGC